MGFTYFRFCLAVNLSHQSILNRLLRHYVAASFVHCGILIDARLPCISNFKPLIFENVCDFDNILFLPTILFLLLDQIVFHFKLLLFT